jgi:hypothetical protein
MVRYCMPQFATAWPQREGYQKPWRSWPHEIPDAFVREFSQTLWMKLFGAWRAHAVNQQLLGRFR